MIVMVKQQHFVVNNMIFSCTCEMKDSPDLYVHLQMLRTLFKSFVHTDDVLVKIFLQLLEQSELKNDLKKI